jgi:hypothetical protein
MKKVLLRFIYLAPMIAMAPLAQADTCLDFAMKEGKILTSCKETGVTGSSEFYLVARGKKQLSLTYCNAIGSVIETVVLKKYYDFRTLEEVGAGGDYIAYDAIVRDQEWTLLNLGSEHNLIVTKADREITVINTSFKCDEYETP